MDSYIDPVLVLARDPDLNREKSKTSQLIRMIHDFPPSERRVSKLCSLSLTILQTLEKIELQTKNWAFLSLNINSDSHFEAEDDKKRFNNEISNQVLEKCQDLQKSLFRITQDLDHITRASRSLTPIEFLSDSGTLLTQLTLRNIKLKDKLTDSVTIAYSRARLITIGFELELILSDEGDDQTIATYQNFVAGLLKQLNVAIEEEDYSGKHECLALISDVEKMYNSFREQKLEEWAAHKYEEEKQVDKGQDQRGKEANLQEEYFDIRKQNQAKETNGSYREPDRSRDSSTPFNPEKNCQGTNYDDLQYITPKGSATGTFDDELNDTDSEFGSHSMHSSTYSQPPMVQSITKVAKRKDSISSFSTTALQKSTISEELPYLLSAFDSARNFEEDVSHYMEDDKEGVNEKNNQTISKNQNNANTNTAVYTKTVSSPTNKSLSSSPVSAGVSSRKDGINLHQTTSKPIFKSTHLPDTSLYHESTVRQYPSAASYSYLNNTLLSKLGIKPQVVDIRTPMGSNTNINNGKMDNSLSSSSPYLKRTINTGNNRFMVNSYHGNLLDKENIEDSQEDKAEGNNLTKSLPNLSGVKPLTTENLASLENEIE